MRNLLKWFKSWFTHPLRQLDRTISGSFLNQLATILLIFILFGAIGFGLSYTIDSKKTPPINKEIDSRFWSTVAQMLDPGNLHMVGNGKADTLIILNNGTFQSLNKGKVEKPETIKAIKNESSVSDTNQSKKTSNWLRLFVFFGTVTGSIIFGGLLISTITTFFEQRVHNVREGMINYRYKNHVVILGCSNMVTGLVQQLINKPEYSNSNIVLLTSQSVPDIKRKLMSELSANSMKRLYILYGDRTSKSDLKRLWLPFANEVYILGEDNEPDHDSQNNSSMVEIEGILKQFFTKEYNRTNMYPKILDCNILFESQTTYVAHQFRNFQELNAKGKKLPTPLNINAFSFYEKWAQKVFVGCSHNEISYSPLDYEAITLDSDKYVHVIIGGMTRMGFAIGVQVARLGHYANFERKKTKITFIDAHTDREIDYFASRFQNFYDAVDVNFVDLLSGTKRSKPGALPYIDVELNFVNGHFESPEVRKMLVNWTSDINALTTIAICFNDPGICLAAGMYLPNEIFKNRHRIIIQQETAHSIISLLRDDTTKVENRYRYVTAFGMVNDCIDLSLNDDFNAKAVNYFYYSNSLPDRFDEKIIKDMDDCWKGLRERFKWSSRYNAESIPTKLRAIGMTKDSVENLQSYFSDENIELLAKMEHARWNVDTLLTGFEAPSSDILNESTRTADLAWEAYNSSGKNGEDTYKELKESHESVVNNYKRKMIHPCLAPYEKLSEYYKDIDRKLVKCIPVIKNEFYKIQQNS